MECNFDGDFDVYLRLFMFGLFETDNCFNSELR